MSTPKNPTKAQFRAIQQLFASPIQSGKVRLAAFQYLKSVAHERKAKALKTKKTPNKGLFEVPCSDKYL